MPLSARNHLKGEITDVLLGTVTAFTDRRILLVDRRDGKDLSSAEGPFRIVVPGEKRHARWIRNVTALSIKTAE